MKLLPCSESVLEPCLSCGRVDQPERLHTHPSPAPSHAPAPGQRHKSPLKVDSIINSTQFPKLVLYLYFAQEQKTDAKNVKEKSDSGQSQKDTEKERPRRGRRSQSPRKSLSPEKSYSPTENSQSSPQVKRRNKNSTKSSEKENTNRGEASSPSSATEAYKSPKKLRIPKQKIVEGRPKQNIDFTVDIFTSRTNEEREKDRIENLNEHQEVDLVSEIVMF